MNRKVQATHEEIVQAGQYLYNVFTDWKQFKDETKWAEILADYAAWKAESGRVEEQKSFEVWAARNGLSIKRSIPFPNEYFEGKTQRSWWGWQARAAMLAHSQPSVNAKDIGQKMCLGYPRCDGRLPGEPHEPECPLSEPSVKEK